MNKKDDLDEKAQPCLNPDCDAILFVSGKMSPDTDARGIDRNIKRKTDEKGTYVECSTCGSKHTVFELAGPEGSGSQWRINGLRF